MTKTTIIPAIQGATTAATGRKWKDPKRVRKFLDEVAHATRVRAVVRTVCV